MPHALDNSDLLDAPFLVRDGLHVIGRGLWLYVWLVRNVNAQGIVCRQVASIVRDLQAPEGEIVGWLERLVAAKLVEVETPPPYLVVKLTMWPGGVRPTDENVSPNGENRSATEASEPVAIEKQASKLALHAQNNTKHQASTGVEVPGEGGSDLLAEIRSAIGTDEGLDDLLSRFSEPVIRTALAKTRSTPNYQIKKSRAALFWFLIGKYAHDHASP